MLCLFLSSIFIPKNSHAKDYSEKPAIHLYSGAAIQRDAPLVQILRLSIPDLENFFITTIGVKYPFIARESFSLEGELSFTHHSENIYAAQTDIVFRSLNPPWHRIIKGSVAFGIGLSYATAPPEVEILANGSSGRLLLHLLIEFEFFLGNASPWSVFFRIHHRSGIFGLFGGHLGGSDYLCVGPRLHF